jgi:hypothetical protein
MWLSKIILDFMSTKKAIWFGLDFEICERGMFQCTVAPHAVHTAREATRGLPHTAREATRGLPHTAREATRGLSSTPRPQLARPLAHRSRGTSPIPRPLTVRTVPTEPTGRMVPTTPTGRTVPTQPTG